MAQFERKTVFLKFKVRSTTKDEMMGRERKSHSMYESRGELNQIFLGSRPEVTIENTELWLLLNSSSAMPKISAIFLNKLQSANLLTQ